MNAPTARRPPTVLPVLVALTIGIVSARLAWTLSVDERAELSNAAHYQLLRVWTDLRTGLDAVVQVLDLVAQLCERQEPGAVPAVSFHAGLYLGAHPELLALARVDATGVHPLAVAPGFPAPDGALATTVASVRTRAPDGRGAAVHLSAPLALADGTRGFVIVRPLHPTGELVGVVRYASLFRHALDPDLLRDCGIVLKDGAALAHAEGDPGRGAWTFTDRFPMQDRTWELRVDATAGAVPLATSSSPALVLGAGSLLAVLVGVLLWMMRAAQGRAAVMQELNVDLASQIHERRRLEAELARRMQDLESSNAELEQFAYVASHDLQEPLRMVASYTQLLSERYGGQLDERAHMFIHFAVDGATRMQTLIHDLLEYARAGQSRAESAPVDLGDAWRDALVALAEVRQETGARITADALPHVRGHRARLVQLFTNLLSNALKFRRADQAPAIHLSVHGDESHWILSLRDDGIGVAAADQDRIFQIFERLHPRSRYPGTGIGLALCKRIVDRHGGRIWVESAPGAGATFHVALPRRAAGSSDAPAA